MDKIAYFEDIVQELSSEFKINEKEMREICEISLKHIHTLTRDPKVVSIKLPNLGVLHFNKKLGNAALANPNYYNKYTNLIAEQVSMCDKLVSFNKNSVHSKRSFLTHIRRSLYPKASDRVKIKRPEILKLIEINQNK